MSEEITLTLREVRSLIALAYAGAESLSPNTLSSDREQKVMVLQKLTWLYMHSDAEHYTLKAQEEATG